MAGIKRGEHRLTRGFDSEKLSANGGRRDEEGLNRRQQRGEFWLGLRLAPDSRFDHGCDFGQPLGGGCANRSSPVAKHSGLCFKKARDYDEPE